MVTRRYHLLIYVAGDLRAASTGIAAAPIPWEKHRSVTGDGLRCGSSLRTLRAAAAVRAGCGGSWIVQLIGFDVRLVRGRLCVNCSEGKRRDVRATEQRMIERA